MEVGTTLTAVAVGLRSSASIVRGAKELVGELAEVFGNELLPDQLLRVAYLDIEYNRRILDVLPTSATKGAAGGTDKAYFQYGPLFRIDSLVAVLMQFRTNKTEIRKDWLSGTQRTRDVMKILDRQDIISLTREVVVSIQALQAIATIPVEARTKVAIRRRLLNVRTRLEMLRDVLKREDALKALTDKAKPLRPRAVPPLDS